MMRKLKDIIHEHRAAIVSILILAIITAIYNYLRISPRGFGIIYVFLLSLPLLFVAACVFVLILILRSKRKAFWLILLFAFYTAGYGVARGDKWIVHRAGYYTERDGSMRVAGHYISPGDFGVPIFFPVGSAVQYTAFIVYWPYRQLERTSWYIKVPRGTPWPSDWELRYNPYRQERTFPAIKVEGSEKQAPESAGDK